MFFEVMGLLQKTHANHGWLLMFWFPSRSAVVFVSVFLGHGQNNSHCVCVCAPACVQSYHHFPTLKHTGFVPLLNRLWCHFFPFTTRWILLKLFWTGGYFAFLRGVVQVNLKNREHWPTRVNNNIFMILCIHLRVVIVGQTRFKDNDTLFGSQSSWRHSCLHPSESASTSRLQFRLGNISNIFRHFFICFVLAGAKKWASQDKHLPWTQAFETSQRLPVSRLAKAGLKFVFSSLCIVRNCETVRSFPRQTSELTSHIEVEKHSFNIDFATARFSLKAIPCFCQFRSWHLPGSD